MIDTVKLVQPLAAPLPRGAIDWQYANSKEGIVTSILCPSAEDKRLGRYVPKLTYVNRYGKYELVIEVSLPKMRYGNNFFEISDDDYQEIVMDFEAYIVNMGLSPYIVDVENMLVRRIDFCKNIILTDGALASSVISGVRTADISKIYEIRKSNFDNGGQALHVHTNLLDVVFYDKVTDLERANVSEKRSLEQHNYCQKDLLLRIKKLRKKHPLSVLRFEVRLNGRRQVKSELERLGIEAPLTFKGLFKNEISRAILLDHWQKIHSKVQAVQLIDDSPITIFRDLLNEPQRQTPQRVLSRLAYALLLANTNDIRAIRQPFEECYGNKEWYRLKKMQLPVQKNQLKSLAKIGETIEQMKPIKKL